MISDHAVATCQIMQPILNVYLFRWLIFRYYSNLKRKQKKGSSTVMPIYLMRYLFEYIFLMYLGELPTHIYSIWFRFFPFKLTYFLALRNEWQTNDCVKLREKETLLSVSSCKTYAYFPTKIARDHLSSYKRSLLPAAASIAKGP